MPSHYPASRLKELTWVRPRVSARSVKLIPSLPSGIVLDNWIASGAFKASDQELSGAYWISIRFNRGSSDAGTSEARERSPYSRGGLGSTDLWHVRWESDVWLNQPIRFTVFEIPARDKIASTSPTAKAERMPTQWLPSVEWCRQAHFYNLIKWHVQTGSAWAFHLN